MASPGLSEAITTTLRNRRKEVADNVTDNAALLKKLKMRGKQMPFSGGRELMHELSYQENSTFKRYSGYELLDISPTDVLTAATYPIKQAAVAVTISGLEELQNAGEEQMLDLLDERIKVAIATMKNNLSADVYSDGTASNGKQMTGLAAMVSTSPTTGTVGGINRANHSFWRNVAKTFDFDAANADVESALDDIWPDLVRGNDGPDLIVADNTAWKKLMKQFQDRQRYTNPKGDLAKSGWNTLNFMGAEIVLDGGQGGNMPAKQMYLLNCDYLFYRPHSKRNMEPLDSGRYSTNQDAMVQLIAWAGNMAMSNASLQGVISDS